MINNRYEIVRTLGRGGSGEVFLATDFVKKMPVAMKVLSSTSTSESNSREIYNEFSILSHLQHPNLVRVYDFGCVRNSTKELKEGTRYYTMELLEGTDALSFFSAIPGTEEKISLLLQALIQILGVLDYVHRAGIIHFDVKPQNIQVGKDAEGNLHTKLTDFGFSESRIDSVDVPIRGTLEYTAPEVIQGLPANCQLDLYSLGISFYELLENRLPFKGSTPIELLKNIVAAEFPALRATAGVNPILVEIIKQLCSKDPAHRPPSGRAVLMNFASTKYEDDVKKVLYASGHPLFVGREDERESIRECVQALRSDVISPERGRKFILITGARGVGRTALLNEVMREFSSSGTTIIRLERSLTEDSHRFIQHCVDKVRSESTAIPNPCRIALAATTDEEQQSDDGRGMPTVLENASGIFPWILCVDDAHLMDDATKEVLLELNQSDSGNYAVILTVPDTELKESGFVDVADRTIHLHELSYSELDRVFIQMLGESFNQIGFTRRFFDMYGGNPSVLMEGIRSLANALPLKLVTDVPALTEMREHLEEFLSGSLEESFARWFHELKKEQQLILEILSCIDIPVSREMMQEFVPFQADRLGQYLSSLEQQGYLQLVDNQLYSIRHRKLRTYIYDSQMEDRTRIHSFIAETADKAWQKGYSWDLGEIGRQYSLSGDRGRALSFYENASETSVANQSFGQAADYLEHAIHCLNGEPAERYLSLGTKLARAHFFNDANKQCLAVCDKLFDQSADAENRFHELYKIAGKASLKLGENERAMRYFDLALRDTTGDVDRLEIQQEIVALNITEGRYDDAVRLSERQRELADRSDDNGMRALVETDLGIAHFHRGSFQESLQSFHIAYSTYHQLGNTAKTIDSLNNIGNVLSALNDFRGALEKWKHALALGSENVTAFQRAQIMNNIGIAHYKLREFPEAKVNYSDAMALFHSMDSRNGIAFSCTNLSEVALSEGDYEAALQYCADALDLYRQMQDTSGEAQSLLQMAQVYILLEDVPHASAAIEKSFELIKSHDLETLTGLVRYLNGALHGLKGNYQEAISEYSLSVQGLLLEGALTGGFETGVEKQIQATLRMIEIRCKMNEMESTGDLLAMVQSDAKPDWSPLLAAEVCLTLGIIARKHPNLVTDKALMYFRRGLSLIENEQVSELSWKLSYALGQEFVQRGKLEKAIEHFQNGKLVIEYFLKMFKIDSLKNAYLRSERRWEVFEEIEILIRAPQGE